jgi:hypothetical protein
VPTRSLEVIKAALEILSHRYPQTKETGADLIIDTSVMRASSRAGLAKRCTRTDAMRSQNAMRTN